jgi:biotin carboxyl carrier protein
MYQVKVNDKFDFEIGVKQQELTINDEVVILDRQPLNGHSSHVLYQNKSYTIEVITLDPLEKKAMIKVNGVNYSIAITDHFDLLLKQLGMDNLTANKVLQVKAPMPGLVLSLLVTEGDEVKKGDNLLVLEAMKMENMIKSPTDGIIKNIAVKPGDKVEKNEVLINFY